MDAFWNDRRWKIFFRFEYNSIKHVPDFPIAQQVIVGLISKPELNRHQVIRLLNDGDFYWSKKNNAFMTIEAALTK